MAQGRRRAAQVVLLRSCLEQISAVRSCSVAELLVAARLQEGQVDEAL